MRLIPFLVLWLLPIASAQEPSSAAAIAKQALEARNAGRTERSIELYSLALTLNPEDTESWWYQGLNYYDLDRYGKCEEAFLKVTEQAPGNAGAFAFLGLCEVQNKKYKTAFAHLVVAQQKGLPQGTELGKVVLYHYIALANKIGQFELASGLLADVSKNPKFDVPKLVEMAGISALRLEVLPEQLTDEQREPVLMAGRASVLAWRQRLPEALAEAEALLAKHPKTPNTHYLKGYVLLLQHSEEALNEFLREVELDPNHVQARLQVALEYLRRGEAEKGLPYAEKAVSLEPADFTAQNIYGRVLLDLDKADLAVAHLQTAVKLAPTSPEAHFHLASALARAGRMEEAARHRQVFKELEESRAKLRGGVLPRDLANAQLM